MIVLDLDYLQIYQLICYNRTVQVLQETCNHCNHFISDNCSLTMNGAEESPHVRVIHGSLQRGRPSVICNSNKHEFKSDSSEVTRINRNDEYSDYKMVKQFIGEDLDQDWTRPPRKIP